MNVGPTILLVRFSAVGDCVMAAWAATALRERFPNATVVWAVESRCAGVIDTARLASKRLEFPRHLWKRHRWSPATWREQLLHYTSLRKMRFDLGFDLHGHSKTALCLALAKPGRKASAYATDSLARRLCPPIGDRPPGTHQVEWMLETVRSLEPVDAPQMPLMPQVSKRFFGDTPWVASIAVGAGQSRNVIPAGVWFRVGELLRDAGWNVCYFGGPEMQFSAPTGTQDLVGKTTLAEWTHATATSDLVLAGDTGTGHIAAAYGVPIVSLFGLSDPRTFRPYTRKGKVLLPGDAGLGHRPEAVLAASRDLMGDQWPSGS